MFFHPLLLLVLCCAGLQAFPTVRVRIYSKFRLQEAELRLHGAGWFDGQRYLTSGRYQVRLGHGGVVLSGAGYRETRSRFRLLQTVPEPQFSVTAAGITRRYPGTVEFLVQKDELVLVCLVSLESYVASVLFGEVPSLSGRKNILEALKAQAVAIRSYAVYYLNPARVRHPAEDCDFCDLTHCQVFRGVVPDGFAVIRRAALETKGKVLRYRGFLVPGFYSSTCGGRTVSPGEVWGDGSLDRAFPGRVHLLAGKVPCRDSEHFTWQFSIERKLFRDFFTVSCFPLLSESALVLVKGPGGSVGRLEADGRQVPGYHFRNLFCKQWGWNSLRSLDFTLKVTRERVVFSGRGLGHRIGLCQHGAFACAAAGWSWRRILAQYYPELTVQ